MMSRDVLPIAIILFVLLVAVTGFAAQSGMHLQDGIYKIGVDDPALAQLFASDARFTVYETDAPTLVMNRDSYDLIVINGQVYGSTTDKGKAAVKTLERDYGKYVNSVYNQEDDLFAAYPLWIDVQDVKSELDFMATQSGEYVSVAPNPGAPVPAGEIKSIPTPSPTLQFSAGPAAAGTGENLIDKLPDLAVYRRAFFRQFHGIVQDAVPALAAAAL